MAVERGCGYRVKGGLYLCTGLSADGSPIEDFLVDPPKIINPAMLGLSPVGMTLIKRGDTYHILDWVGSEHYPNVADFIEEARRYGTSRRASAALDFSKLGPGSRHLYVHSRAGILNYADFDAAIVDSNNIPDSYTDAGTVCCPKFYHYYKTEGGPCLGQSYHDLEGGEADTEQGAHARRVIRAMPSFSYQGHKRPDGFTLDYAPAIFASFPITSIQLVTGGPDDERARELASKASIPLLEVES